MQKLNFEVVSYADEKFTPFSVKRILDQEVFTVGDFVTNGTKMKGLIESFSLNSDLSELYVYTDWSGIGMNLDSLVKNIKIPSYHQISDCVELNFFSNGYIKNCKIRKIHFTESKVLYDIDLFEEDMSRIKTRIYNIDSVFVIKIKNLKS